MNAMNPVTSLCGVVGFWLALLASAATADVARGMVYELSRDGRFCGYLVGTMHSEDPRVTALMQRFTPMISRVDGVAIELIPDAVAMMAVGAATLLPAEQRLHQIVGPERFAALRAAAADLDLSIEVLDRLKPWAAAMVVAMPPTGSGQILDMQIYLEAQGRQRELIGLETAAEQIGVFSSMAPALQLALFDGVVKKAAEMPKLLEALTRAYLLGDPHQLARIAEAQYADVDPAVADWLDEVLIVARNRRMLERLRERLARQRLFVAVGAMHLVGESGLIEGLRRQGYRVERNND